MMLVITEKSVIVDLPEFALGPEMGMDRDPISVRGQICIRSKRRDLDRILGLPGSEARRGSIKSYWRAN